MVHTACVLCVGAFYLSVYLSLTTETEETCDIFMSVLPKHKDSQGICLFFSIAVSAQMTQIGYFLSSVYFILYLHVGFFSFN